jgi:hypothetical protein
MRTMGIVLGGQVMLIERRGEQQIVHDALVLHMSMDPADAGTLGEMMIDVVWVNEHLAHRRRFSTAEWEHALFFFTDVVHISHRDWIEGRASLGYEELPGSVPGVCRYCRCTEARACAGGCYWLYPEQTVCSNPDCAERYVQDNLLRTAAKGAA